MIPEALSLIGAKRYSDLVSRANMVFETANEQITRFQDDSLEGFSKSYEDNPLDKFDDEYYDLEKSENIDTLRIEFIRKNKAEFVDN